jgi:hypothetical protein
LFGVGDVVADNFADSTGNIFQSAFVIAVVGTAVDFFVPSPSYFDVENDSRIHRLISAYICWVVFVRGTDTSLFG